MATAPQQFEATLPGENSPLAMATMLPYTGLNLAQLDARRNRWLTGEAVSATSTVVGKLALSKVIHLELEKALEAFEYEKLLHGDYESDDLLDMLGPAGRYIKPLQQLVAKAAIYDANRRGFNDSEIGLAQTRGGLKMSAGPSQLHIEDREATSTLLTYITAPIGISTGVIGGSVSYADILNDEGICRTNKLGQPTFGQRALAGGSVDITMFDLITPHAEPPADDLPRLATLVDIKV